MQLLDIATRVRAMLDGQDGTYCDDAYVLGHAQHAYDWIYNKLRLINSDCDEQIIILPAVAAGTPDLSGYMAAGQPLATPVQPRTVRCRLPGPDAASFRRADGPLDYVRDIGQANSQLVYCAWIIHSPYLSQFS